MFLHKAASTQLLWLLEVIIKGIRSMSESQAALQAAIDTLVADNAELRAAVESAPARIASIVAAAVAMQGGGITPEHLQALADLHASFGGQTAQLNAALAGTSP